MRFYGSLCFLAIALASSHCALFGGGNGDNLRHASGYKVATPSDWKSIEKGESDSAYRLPSGAIMELTSSCKQRNSTSLEVLTKQLLMGTRNIRIEKQEKVPISNGSGLLTQLSAQDQGSVVYLDVIVFSERGCVFDFSLVGKTRFSEPEVSQFLQLAKSLQYDGN